ncbi:type II toxin-antitoxin system VapC family toxin [Sinomonas halotolerans]|uniref:Type II toxin-antitoxin system VapC family toxin n=1 Tax=Sinomonas halotolerans TaxID=1644133 RepID=A0ABU9X1Z1_9MICC
MGRPPYLLDSHALVWALTEPRKLSRKAKNAIESWESILIASAVTAYELSYKRRAGRLPGLEGLFVGYRRHVLELTAEELPISGVHALEAGGLEWEHRDPFDRLIAAQALVEGFTLITADPVFDGLEGLEVLW